MALYAEAGYYTTNYVQEGVTVDWVPAVIYIPKDSNPMTLIQSVPNVIYELDMDVFRADLKALEADTPGMPFTDTHEHIAPIPIGGISLARVVTILAPYTVTFEDDLYTVNLVGANTNLNDRNNKNQVSVNPNNSAGLINNIDPQAIRDAMLLFATTGAAPIDTKVDNTFASIWAKK